MWIWGTVNEEAVQGGFGAGIVSICCRGRWGRGVCVSSGRAVTVTMALTRAQGSERLLVLRAVAALCVCTRHTKLREETEEQRGPRPPAGKGRARV